jgi:hypothetical protein
MAFRLLRQRPRYNLEFQLPTDAYPSQLPAVNVQFFDHGHHGCEFRSSFTHHFLIAAFLLLKIPRKNAPKLPTVVASSHP